MHNSNKKHQNQEKISNWKEKIHGILMVQKDELFKKKYILNTIHKKTLYLWVGFKKMIHLLLLICGGPCPLPKQSSDMAKRNVKIKQYRFTIKFHLLLTKGIMCNQCFIRTTWRTKEMSVEVRSIIKWHGVSFGNLS